jgi:hypothetical protein
MALYLKNEDWRLIAEQVSNETDPAKLTLLVEQLCHALDDREKGPQLERRQENKTLRDVA